jgi:hypothetical protein
VRAISPAEFRATDLGLALEECARLVEHHRDLLTDEDYAVFVDVFGRWFEREHGRVHHALGAHQEPAA